MKNLLTFLFSGRLNRSRYTNYVFSVLGAWTIFTSILDLVVPITINLQNVSHTSLLISGVLSIVFFVLALFFYFALTVKRAHDLDQPFGFALLCLIPFVNMMFLYLPGTKKNNRYGAPQKSHAITTIIAVLLNIFVLLTILKLAFNIIANILVIAGAN